MSSTTPNPPPGSWIPPFLSRYADPAPPLPSTSLPRPTGPPSRDPNAPAPNSLYTSRGRRQASIFFAGVVAVVWAGSMTRRNMAKRLAPLPGDVLLQTVGAPGATMGQGAQVARAVGQQAAGAGAGVGVGSVGGAATITTEAAAVAGKGKAKGMGIMAETLQSYRGGVRQTSPGTSVGSRGGVAESAAVAATEAGVVRPVGDAVSQVAQQAGGQAPAAAAELGGSGPIMAVEALFLATANVLAWALLVTGGALWYADISSIEEMQKVVRGGLGVDGTGRTEQEAEEELEEWFAKVLKRSEDKAETARFDERGRAR